MPRLGARRAGELAVEDIDEGVLLKAAPLFAATEIGAVCGSRRFEGRTKTIEEMDEAIADVTDARGTYKAVIEPNGPTPHHATNRAPRAYQGAQEVRMR